MAGNNSIQILRGTSANITASDETLLAGQMLYNTDKNYLTVGSNDGDALNKMPVVARELLAYDGDTSQITACTTQSARVVTLPNAVNLGAKSIDVWSCASMSGQHYLTMAQSGIELNSGVAAGTTITGSSVTLNVGSIPIIINSYQASSLISVESFPMRISSGGQLALQSNTAISLSSSGSTGVNITTPNTRVSFSTSAGYGKIELNSLGTYSTVSINSGGGVSIYSGNSNTTITSDLYTKFYEKGSVDFLSLDGRGFFGGNVSMIHGPWKLPIGNNLLSGTLSPAPKWIAGNSVTILSTGPYSSSENRACYIKAYPGASGGSFDIQLSSFENYRISLGSSYIDGFIRFVTAHSGYKIMSFQGITQSSGVSINANLKGAIINSAAFSTALLSQPVYLNYTSNGFYIWIYQFDAE